MPRVASDIARGSSSRPVARPRFGDSPRNRSSHGSWPGSAGILELTSFVVLDGVTQNRNRKELHVVRTLLLRVVVGGTKFLHGAQKLFGWFGGPGLRGTGGFLGSVGWRSP